MAKPKGGERKAEFTPQRFTVSFELFPQIAMIRENALRLATVLASHHELTDIHMSDESWEFKRPVPKQGEPRGLIQVTVEEQEVQIEHRYPSGGLERFEVLVGQVVDSIEQIIRPQILLGSVASLKYLVEISSDARKAILGALGLEGEEGESDKLQVFNRPCQFVGLRLGFPPYHVTKERDSKDENPLPPSEATEKLIESTEIDEKSDIEEEETAGEEWAATLTLESLPDDASRLSVDVHGHWIRPVAWEEIPDKMNDRIKTIDDFLRTKTTEFLKHFRREE